MQDYNAPYCFFAAKSDKPDDKVAEGEFDEDALTEDYGIVRLPPLVPENTPDAKKEINEMDDILKKYLEK
jgi:hypothetical protein